jgi:hypothetical protein
MLLHRFGGLPDRVDDARMRAATADIALKGVHDVRRAWICIFLQKTHAVHDHSRSAIRALKCAGVQKSLLHWMQTAIFFESFDRRDGFPRRCAYGNLA